MAKQNRSVFACVDKLSPENLSINAGWKTPPEKFDHFLFVLAIFRQCNCMSLFFAAAADMHASATEHAVNMDAEWAASFSGRLDTTKYLFLSNFKRKTRATILKSHCSFFWCATLFLHLLSSQFAFKLDSDGFLKVQRSKTSKQNGMFYFVVSSMFWDCIGCQKSVILLEI